MDSTKQQEDAMPPRECRERKEDRFSYKVIKIATNLDLNQYYV